MHRAIENSKGDPCQIARKYGVLKLCIGTDEKVIKSKVTKI